MAKADKTDKGDYKGPEPKDSVHDTIHKITLNGHDLHYLATAGTLVLHEDDGKPLASIFFVSYNKVDGPNGAKVAYRLGRSCFASTAGPAHRRFGCTWEHSGRKRFACRTMAKRRCCPIRSSTTNSRFSTQPTWCSLTQSRPGSASLPRGVDAKRFHGFQEDIQSVGDFIQLFTHGVTAASAPTEICRRRKLRHHPPPPACPGISRNATACT